MKIKQVCVATFLLFHLGASVAGSHDPEKFLHDIEGTPDEGEQIVKHYCSSCHAHNPIIPLGAPRMGYPAEWSPRLKQGFAMMFKHASEGLNAMPARGGCFECSDEQLMRAMRFLLKENIKNNQQVKK